MAMSFVEVKKQREYMRANTANIVRVSFHQHGNKKTGQIKGYNMHLYLGKDIAKRVGIEKGDRIKFYTEESNPKIWFIRKAADHRGYSVVDSQQANGTWTNAFRIVMKWNAFEPTAEEQSLHKISYTEYKDGILIFFDQDTKGKIEI